MTEAVDLLVAHQENAERAASHAFHHVYLKALRDLELHGFHELRAVRVLDLGCGQRYPFSLCIAPQATGITALDVDIVAPRGLASLLVTIAVKRGLRRAAKTALRRVLFDKRYYAALARESGIDLELARPRIEFVTADPDSLTYPLPDNSYDLTFSNAVLEHVTDVPAVAQEIARMLRPGGYTYNIIHNYYSLSGAHSLEWVHPEESKPRRSAPWDHLRARQYPPHMYLNKLLPDGYLGAFARHLEILEFSGRDVNHDQGQAEGEEWLTDDIRDELPEYPKELLLTRAWCLVARKPVLASNIGTANSSTHSDQTPWP